MMEDFYAAGSKVSSIAEHASDRYADLAIIHTVTTSATLMIDTREINKTATAEKEDCEVYTEFQRRNTVYQRTSERCNYYM